jgi:hypothetical protein
MSEKRKALFAISIDSSLFTTERTIAALEQICNEHDGVLFLIADALNVYNKVNSLKTPEEIVDVLAGFTAKSEQQLTQRTTWLSRIRNRLPERAQGIEWKVSGMRPFMDSECYAIYRRLLLLFHTTPEFRHDVVSAAERHLKNSQTIVPGTEVRQRLSESYVLEEIAMALRIRAVEGYEDEYYLGIFFEPMLGIFEGKYSVSLSTIVGGPISLSFRFFKLGHSEADPLWVEVHAERVAGSQVKR